MKGWLHDWKRPVLVLTLCLSVFLAACGGLLSSVQSGWAATKPFIQNLAAQGVISQAKADAAILDVDGTLAAGRTAERCVADIPADVTGNAKKVAKGHCYFAFAQSFRAILARHNIGGSPALDKFALIGEGFILALEEYFRSVTSAHAEGTGTVGDPDKRMESAMKEKLKELKAITGK